MSAPRPQTSSFVTSFLEAGCSTKSSNHHPVHHPHLIHISAWVHCRSFMIISIPYLRPHSWRVLVRKLPKHICQPIQWRCHQPGGGLKRWLIPGHRVTPGGGEHLCPLKTLRNGSCIITSHSLLERGQVMGLLILDVVLKGFE